MRSTPKDSGQPRRIAGTFLNSGNGPGWVAVKNSTGNYTVRFSPPFRTVPHVNVITASGGPTASATSNPAPDSVTILTFATTTGGYGDWTTYFEAIGNV